MWESSTKGRYKFYCDGFNKHFDKAEELQAYVDNLKTKFDIKGKEYKIWDKENNSSVPVKTGFIS